jgi:hypothetical protein
MASFVRDRGVAWRLVVCVVVGCAVSIFLLSGAAARGVGAAGSVRARSANGMPVSRSSAVVAGSGNSHWRVLTRVPGPKRSELVGVSCTSRAACTAVGDTIRNSDGENLPPDLPLAERWNGSRWSLQRTATLHKHWYGLLYSVSCSSRMSCSAVGATGVGNGFRSYPLVEQWNGSRWSIQPSPHVFEGQLFTVSCGSARSCMAVGINPNTGCGALAEHWDGHGWSVQRAVYQCNVDQLNGVSCTSASSCAAVGYLDVGACDSSSDYFVPVLGFWKRGRWSLHQTSKLSCRNPKGSNQGATMTAVSCKTASACAAVGIGYRAPIIERWDGRQWSRQSTALPSASELSGISCASRSTCTAVGSRRGSPLVERWTGAAWSIEQNPGVRGGHLSGVSCPSTTMCAAVGATRHGPLVEQRF